MTFLKSPIVNLFSAKIPGLVLGLVGGGDEHAEDRVHAEDNKTRKHVDGGQSSTESPTDNILEIHRI